jgi:hypothetical protein
MSTRAQIAIQIGAEEWVHVYCHYDGYPSHMLPALTRWTPDDILAAREVRQVRANEIEGFENPHDPPIFPHPTCEFCHLYVWQDGMWVEITPDTIQPERTLP